MSFRGDDQRRYGHVPPVQYPVASQHDQTQYPARRPSFNDGDDTAFFDQGRQPPPPPPPPPPRGEDELFLTSPTSPTSATSSRLTYSSSQSAMSGYQHQYQGQAPPTPSHSYNPQAFARSQSTSLPYHPASRYASSTSPTYPTQQQQSPVAYTPQTYNPAAYANTNAPQRTATYAGYNNYAHSYSSPAVPQTTTTYGQGGNPVYSPSQTQAPSLSAQPSYDPSLSSGQSGTPSTLPATPYDSSYSTTFSGGSYFNTYSANGASPSSAASAAPASAHAAATSQAPYPTYSQIPVGPNYSAADPNAFINRVSRSSSTASSVPSPPTHSSSSPGLQRHPTNAPLPSRPMENVPEETDWGYSGRAGADERLTQDSLIQDIVADLGVAANPQRPRPINGNVSGDDLNRLRHYDSSASTAHSMDDGTGADRYSSTASTVNRNNARSAYEWRSDDSDPEGAFGVYEMQQADLENRRFSGDTVVPQSATTTVPTLSPQAEEQQLSDTEFVGMDLGLFSGGYAGNLTYGNDVGSYANEFGSPAASGQVYEDERDVRPLPHSRSYGAEPPYPEDDHMDYGGTGGLQAPNIHRLSFDEGEERVSVHSQHSDSESPYKDDYPDMFYHPGLTNRPLPAIPPGSDSSSLLSVQAANKGPYQHGYSLSGDSGYAGYGAQSSQSVERSVSLSSHSNTPQVHLPGRARTDAAEERRKASKQMTQQLSVQTGGAYEGLEPAASPNSMAFDMITLPSGRRKKFVPSKLSTGDIRRCAEPWALSGIASWIREMAEGEPDLKRKTIEEGLVKLFTEKVPTMNVADAETLATMVADEMFAAGILIPEEEWVKFGQGSISGVLWQLTGLGCYAPRLHENEMHGRCYSHHCTRTLKKANLDDLLSEESVKKEDWVTHYKITKEIIEGKHKKEIERQNVLHEIVTSEEEYTNQLDVLLVLYRNQLRAWQPPIIPPTKLDSFIKSVFGQAEAVHETNKNNLLAQLKYRQNEQGPWVVGFSDIFREWIRKAREPYIKYSQAYPYASYNVRREANKNVLFRQFLDHVRNHKRSDRLGWDTFLKAPITRLQRYTLLLNTVLKNTIQDSEEKVNLGKAIEEIKNVTLECDKLVAEMQRQVSLVELQTMLVFRPGLASTLNLDHLGRELLWQGDLQRMGSKGVRWVDTHALLFDHFFILAKTVITRDGKNEKKYDVSKEPMPMPLLILESMNDDPVSKQKGLAAPLARTTTAASSDTKLNKVASNGTDRPGLETTATSSSMTSVTRLGPTTSNEEGKILYPFKVKHLGHEIYTLYAATLQSRQDWVNKIIEAKTRHAKALYTQNAEPFRLRVVADSAFAYDSVSAIGKTPAVSIRGTPLDRAIREMEQVYGPGRGPAPVCRASVNCATAFTAFGKSIIAIGTDYGVYISEASDPRGWTRSVQINRVTQIAVLEEFSVCLILADKSLISYPLDVVAPVSNYPAPAHDNSRKAPQRLAKDVSFFATARMKDRMLLFYKRKEGLHNTFKVLEPVYQKATEKKSRLFGSRKGGSGNTESFRDYDEFYLPVDCYSINLFQSYIAVSTAKGIEMLTLDKKQTMSVPRDLTMPAAASIAARLREQKPLGMFRLNEQEFLLAHEDCTVYVNKHGEVSRTLIMEYSGKQKKARAATMFGQYLLLFNEDYVEVRDADNGRLRQIIAGRDVRCLDYGFRGPTGTNVSTASMANGGAAHLPEGVGQDSKGTVKICMAHPEVPGAQIVLELLLNEGHLQKGR
ncbi:uncharacterized protein E0L32_007144 [Thyridium curvatum]|uniref:Rho1 guanine nucleotide exchange factor 3 n=1 Tax=Thyridium curvatum TaxID=1093900 RepID=A0A507B5Y8_9PEZI|nr:uncharacterized protein E0L32_007144 [Thyridium curvatum]TPX12258.1 hypothetical protein E0L32_007144 [Thyridium curvatum]